VSELQDYDVIIQQVVSTMITVRAASPEDAAEQFYQAPGMPGSLTVGAFGGGVSVDEAGDWEAVQVTPAGKPFTVLWPTTEEGQLIR
jgi:hypothetical protein